MNKIILASLVLVFACDVFAARRLKTRVTLGPVQARSFPVPGGGEFDFGFALNSQMMVELTQSPYFSASFRSEDLLDISNTEFVSIVPPTDIMGRIVPQCLIDAKPLEVNGEVISFEMESKTSIKLGYRKGTSAYDGWGIGAKFGIAKWSLWLNLQLAQNDFTGLLTGVAASQGEHKSKETDAEISVDFNGFTVSPSYYHRSKLSEVTSKAVRKAVENIAKSVHLKQDSGEMPWSTTVTRSSDDLVVIAAGSMDGLKRGDRFEIQNMRHEWRGKPCQSRYDGLAVATAAIVEVVAIGPSSSQVRVLQGHYYNDIYVGDKVLINALVD